MKRIYIILLAALILVGCSPKNDGQSQKSEKAGAVIVEEIGNGVSRYKNLAQGFSVEAPSDFSVNENLAQIELRLEREDCVIEVLKEEFEEEWRAENYTWYSNRFLDDNDIYHVEESIQILAAGNYPAKRLQWSREKAGEGDRNYYNVTDIYIGTDVYTVIVKSAIPFDKQDFDCNSVSRGLKKEQVSAENFPVVFTKDGGAPMNGETTAAFEKFFLEDGAMSWGIYFHKQPVEGMEKFEALEEKVGRLDIALLYTEILEEYDPALVYGGLVNAWNSGKICELTLQTDIDDDSNAVYEILRGEHDEFLYAYARDVVLFGHPVILRPFNEMNGEWCNYSSSNTSRDPDVYVRMYRYIYNIFNECGAENVIWVWNPNEVSYPTFKWNSAELYYPGSDYVDAVGLSGYNTGTGIDGEIWRSFSEIYDGYYEHMESTYNKPMMITEFGCSSFGGDKLKWVEDMFADLHKYPKIHAAVWLHDKNENSDTGEVTRSFYIDDTEGVAEVFKKNLSRRE
ncbi:MAG: glycosyl hydrolase [Clostridia bacterium]